MSKYPCKECILISICTEKCGKLSVYPKIKNKTCPDCESKIKYTCTVCEDKCSYCDNCNKKFHEDPSIDRVLINGMDVYCWNDEWVNRDYKIKFSYVKFESGEWPCPDTRVDTV